MKTTLVGVQYLRAIAALMVVYYHLRIQVPALEPYLNLNGTLSLDHLAVGVDLFFVISGFVMWVTSARLAPGLFIARRILRIVPLYWLLTLALVVSAFVAPRLFRTLQFSGAYLWKSLFFVPFANAGQHGDVAPLLVPGWTLNLEMFFYVLFSGALLAPERWRLGLVGTILGLLALVGYLAPALRQSPVLWLYMEPRVLEFWLGMLIGWTYLHRTREYSPLVSSGFIVLGVCCLLGIGFGEAALEWAWVIGAAFVMLGVSALDYGQRIPRIGVLMLLGDASYSIYLTHLFTLGLMRTLWLKAGWTGAWAAVTFAITSLLAIALVAIASYLWIEVPVMTLSKRWTGTRARAPEHVAS